MSRHIIRKRSVSEEIPLADFVSLVEVFIGLGEINDGFDESNHPIHRYSDNGAGKNYVYESRADVAQVKLVDS